MAQQETVRIVDLTRADAEDLASYLHQELTAAGLHDEVELSVITEKRTPRGLAAPIPPELLMAFAKGVAAALGGGVGKLLFSKLRQWAKRKGNTSAKLVRGQSSTQLQDLPTEPPEEQ